MGEIPLSQIEEDVLGAVSVDIYLGGGQHGVGGEQHGGGNADVQPLLVGAAAEKTEHEDAHDAGGKDGIEREECSQDTLPSP